MARPEAGIARSVLEAGASDPDAVLLSALGRGYAAYREAFRRAEAGELPPFPVHLDADVTTRCNLRCPICPAGAGGGGYPGMGIDLDPALYSRALAEGEAGGLMSVRIGVTGEPLLADSPHMWVEEAAGRGVTDVSLITNGQLLYPEVSRRLAAAGLTRLMVSVDAGSEEGYRRARPGGDFRLLLENLRSFLAVRRELGRGIPVLRLSFVVREGTGSERDLFREKFSTLADYLSFQSYSPILERGRMAREAAAEAGPDPDPGSRGQAADSQDPSHPPAKAAVHPGSPESSPCREPFTRICLYADGGLFPCCSDDGRLWPAGSLRGCTVREAWLSRAAFLARRPGRPSHPACLLCRGHADAGTGRPCADPAGGSPRSGTGGTEDAKARAQAEVPAVISSSPPCLNGPGAA
ncbi:MAG: radical SAM protein [Deltaproteobacteria bacterium]|jgi:molybdenum cofactor biosynthesis enzyme MoaA|nr:radical SAM protein [Deltaproteobacteria bacterium]